MTTHELQSAASRGTLATMMALIQDTKAEDLKEANVPYSLSPIKNTRPGPKTSWWTPFLGLHSDPTLGLLTTSMVGGYNAAIVFRTWGLLQQEASRRQQAYGPNFTYREMGRAKGVVSGIVTHFGQIFGLLMLIFPPFRALLSKIIFRPGQGPDREEAKKEIIDWRGTAVPDPKQADGTVAWARLHFKGSMLMASNYEC